MVIKDDFSMASLKLLVSAISLAVIFPIVEDVSTVALYITVCVFIFGKFVDLISKMTQRQFLLFYFIYLVGIITGILALALCFFGCANIAENQKNALELNFWLVGFCSLYCAIDLADFVYNVYVTVYTKHLLHQFE